MKALLLRSWNGPSVTDKTLQDSNYQCDENNDIFFYSEKTQYFLFMPDFIFSKDGPASPKNGVLRRIVSADEILDEAYDVETLNSMHPLYSELGKKSEPQESLFSVYVDASLDCLNFHPLNPWTHYEPKKSISMTDANKQAPTVIPKDRNVLESYEKNSSLDNEIVDYDNLSMAVSGIKSNGRENLISDSNETEKLKEDSAWSVDNDTSGTENMIQSTRISTEISPSSKLQHLRSRKKISPSGDNIPREQNSKYFAASESDTNDSSSSAFSSEDSFGTFHYDNK